MEPTYYIKHPDETYSEAEPQPRAKKYTWNACSVCGWSKNMAIHKPPFGSPEGSKAWGHEYIPKTPNDKAQGEAQGSSCLSPGATGSAAGSTEE